MHQRLAGSIDQWGRALVPIRLGLCEPERAARAAAGHATPAIQQIVGLVDTGCTGLEVDAAVLSRLGVFPFDRRSVTTAAGRIDKWFFRVGVALGDKSGVVLVDAVVRELPPMSGAYQSLIGWELLRSLRLDYDGPGRAFSLGVAG